MTSSFPPTLKRKQQHIANKGLGGVCCIFQQLYPLHMVACLSCAQPNMAQDAEELVALVSAEPLMACSQEVMPGCHMHNMCMTHQNNMRMTDQKQKNVHDSSAKHVHDSSAQQQVNHCSLQ